MEKAFSLSQAELQFVAQTQADHKDALAQYGQLSMSMEEARKRIEALTERQRQFIRMTLAQHGVENFVSARLNGNSIEYSVADGPATVVSPMPEALGGTQGYTNGLAASQDHF